MAKSKTFLMSEMSSLASRFGEDRYMRERIEGLTNAVRAVLQGYDSALRPKDICFEKSSAF